VIMVWGNLILYVLGPLRSGECTYRFGLDNARVVVVVDLKKWLFSQDVE
jgi:hypothetical protein